jgi:acetylornithine deacetylase/succinyl-diaminopimelate desuccinylase-like protein
LEARRPGATIQAWVELHIEQGAVLDTAGLPVGVVTGIAAPSNLRLCLAGAAYHAGATPMTLRNDALTGAAEVILAAPLRPDEARRRELARVALPHVKSFYDGWLDYGAGCDPFYRWNSRQ